MNNDSSARNPVLQIREFILALSLARTEVEQEQRAIALQEFLDLDASNRFPIFCIQSFRAGTALFILGTNISGSMRYGDFQENIKFGLHALANMWASEFRRSPKNAREGYLYAQRNALYSRPNATQAWDVWLAATLKNEYDVDILTPKI